MYSDRAIRFSPLQTFIRTILFEIIDIEYDDENYYVKKLFGLWGVTTMVR